MFLPVLFKSTDNSILPKMSVMKLLHSHNEIQIQELKFDKNHSHINSSKMQLQESSSLI